MNPDYKGKAKVFLEKRLKEYDKKIIKMKWKRKGVKVTFVYCISLSIVSSTVCASLTALIPPVAQRWTWVGSIHGLGWVELNEEYCYFYCILCLL